MKLAASPLRLFSAFAGLQVILLLVLWFEGLLPATVPAVNTLLFILLYGVAGLLLFGALLTFLPRLFHREPVHYAVYVTAGFLMFSGMVLLDIAMFRGTAWMVAGSVAVLLAWTIALRAFWWVAVWVWGPSEKSTRLLIPGFMLAVAGIPMFTLASVFGINFLTGLLIPLELLVIGAIAVTSFFYILQKQTGIA